jgi:hypothetical protein
MHKECYCTPGTSGIQRTKRPTRPKNYNHVGKDSGSRVMGQLFHLILCTVRHKGLAGTYSKPAMSVLWTYVLESTNIVIRCMPAQTIQQL